MHFVLMGSGEVTGAGVTLPVQPYALVVVPPGVDHSFTGAEASGFVATGPVNLPGLDHVVSGEGDSTLVLACGAMSARLSAAGLFEKLSKPIVEDFSDSPRMRELFDALLEEQSNLQAGQLRMIEAIMMQCLVHLLRRLKQSPTSELSWLRALDDAPIRRALDAMLEKPGAPHSLDSLAGVAGMSRSAFSARFAEVLSESPMAFLKQLRLQAAARLLERGELPIKTIAARVGYASRSHFSRAFKEEFGKDPALFRAERGMG